MIRGWLKSWTKRKMSHQARGSLRRAIPSVECLEDRVVPVLFTYSDLQMLSIAPASKVIAGGVETFVATVRNNGPTPAFSMNLTEHFGASFKAVLFNPSSGSYNSSTGNWTGFSLAAGQTIALKVTGIVNNAATGHVNVSATVSRFGVFDPNLSNNSLSASFNIHQVADLGALQSDSSNHGSAAPGSSGTLTVAVFNAGPSAVKGATVTDNFPTDISSHTWTATIHNGASVASSSGSGNISTTVDLPPGAFVIFTIHATISTTATGKVTNTATITAPSGVTDPKLTNNSASDTLTIAT